MRKEFERKHSEPEQVVIQLRAFALLLGCLTEDHSLTENDAYGLEMLGYMIADNVEAMIAKTEEKTHA